MSHGHGNCGGIISFESDHRIHPSTTFWLLASVKCAVGQQWRSLTFNICVSQVLPSWVPSWPAVPLTPRDLLPPPPPLPTGLDPIQGLPLSGSPIHMKVTHTHKHTLACSLCLGLWLIQGLGLGLGWDGAIKWFNQHWAAAKLAQQWCVRWCYL